MESTNTPEELQQALYAMCALRDIDPESTREPPPIAKHVTRDRIEEAKEEIARNNDDYELHGINFTPLPYSKFTSEKHIKSAQLNAKKSPFGKFRV